MAYTKSHADGWIAADTVTTTIMDNFETINAEITRYLPGGDEAHNHNALYQTQTEMRAAYWYAGNDGTGSGADVDYIYKSTGNLHAATFAGMGVPTGIIILWYGSVATIPSGWQLCNGTGTVDLRNIMPVGAGTGSAYAVGNSGGSATFTAAGTITVDGHTLTEAEMGEHRHPFNDAYGSPASNVGPGARYSGTLTSSSGNTTSAGSGSAHGHSAGDGTSFTGDAVNSLPFAMALCYIQKVA